MDFQTFEGKTAIVTGGASGIGYGIAEYLIDNGAHVVVCDIDPARTAEAVDQLNDRVTGRAVGYPGDASDVAFLRDMVDFASEIPGSRLELVVANAGLTEFGDFFEFTEESFARVVNLNLRGTFFLIQAASRRMREQRSGGRIILIGSNVGNRAYPNLAAYGMSKAGIAMLAQQLVLPLGPLGITINCVSPGATLTERTAQEEPDYAGVWAKLNPNKRVALPEDIAEAVGFLLSPGARHITGQQLLIDGGWTGYAPSPFFIRDIENDNGVPVKRRAQPAGKESAPAAAPNGVPVRTE